MEHTEAQATHIRAGEDGEKQFVFHPESNDVFVRTGMEVIASCQIGISIQVWLEELGEFLREVAVWSQSRATSVRAVFAHPIGSRIVLYVIPTSSSFDFDLADLLAKLNRDMVKKFPVIGMVEVLQVPWNDRQSFVSESAKCIYGNSGSTH